MQRLFFALWPPDDSLRTALEAVRKPWLDKAKGRAVDLRNLHLTLAFIGEVPATMRAALEAGADTLRTRTFTLALDCVGNWRRNGILWAGAGDECTELQDLVHGLRRVLRDSGIKPDKRPYEAHVTLARDYFHGPVKPVAMPPLVWPATEFALVESTREDGRLVYRRLRQWPLV